MKISFCYNIIRTKQIVCSKNLMGLYNVFFKVLQSSKYFFPTETKFNFWKLQGITDAQWYLSCAILKILLLYYFF